MMTESTTPAVEITPSSIDELRAICNDASQTLFAILDACDEPRVPEKVRELGEERAVSLYRGAAQRDYWSIAPYVVVVDETLLDWIVENLWEDPWGIFATADSTLDDMRRHFRKFLLVEMPDGEELYFRYYDPRVLQGFLRNSNLPESEEFFGPLISIHLSDNNQLYCFRPGKP